MDTFKLLALISAAFFPPLALATESVPAADSSTQKLIDDVDNAVITKLPLTNPVVPAPVSSKGHPVDDMKPSDPPLLPFWGEEARAKGYDLPETYGIGINYMNMRQNIDVDSISFSGLALGRVPIGPDMFKIGVGNTREQSKTETMRLDAWVLPFMNVYGLLGYTKGSSVSKVGVSVLGSKPPSLQNLDFKLDFKGTTYGVGTTLVGGYDNWFTSVDMNYTQTQFDILDGSINAFTLSPRIGYRFTTPAIAGLNTPQGKVDVWVGSMYQDVQQEFKGDLSNLNMPAELQPMINLVNQSGNGRFDVKQHLQSPWNVLLGTQYELTRSFNITTEFGFANRNSFMVAAEYRF